MNESQMICTVSDLVDEAYYKKALSLRLNPELMQERGANFLRGLHSAARRGACSRDGDFKAGRA